MDATHLLWCDLETTSGGEPDTDRIIEVAVILTTMSLKPIATYAAVIDPSPFDWMRRVESDPKVMTMHVKNGLVGDLLAGRGISVERADHAIAEMLTKVVPGRGRRVHLAGSGVHFDRKFVAAEMPRVEACLLRPQMDVATVRRFISQVVGRSDHLAPFDGKNHRAMDDIRQHYAEMRHYQRVVGAALGFVEPDSGG